MVHQIPHQFARVTDDFGNVVYRHDMPMAARTSSAAFVQQGYRDFYTRHPRDLRSAA